MFLTITDQRRCAKATYWRFEVLFGLLCAVIAGTEGRDIHKHLFGYYDGFQRDELFLKGILSVMLLLE